MKKFLIITGSLIFIMGATVIALFFIPNIQDDSQLLRINKNTSYEQISDMMIRQNMVKCPLTLDIAAHLLQYPTHVRSGKYAFDKRENNFQIILKLRRGQHYPIKFTFNNIRTKQQFIEKVGHRFMFEPEELADKLNDTLFLNQYGFNPQNCVAMMIPNSYEFYYNIDAAEFIKKMYHYYTQFWNQKRRQEADSMGLTPIEVITLASIVEEENFRNEEKAIIAGLYYNRLQRGMKLQADPTVKFAIGDFAKKRIYLEDTEYDSPYNTYKNQGLPPGPIRIPATSTIDSVLHYAHHNYIYMCAKEDLSGHHNFAATSAEHARNADKYHKALNQKEIR